ncbi:MAG: condensation domain-containing protein, partial [Pseudomonadota bacterium]
ALAERQTLECVIVAGEACPPELVARHHGQLPGVALHTEYGPTETTVWCSAAPLRVDEPVRIGRPLVNTRLYVVNRHGQPVPTGAAGELYVGGPQVAQRYAGDAKRSAERFIESPLAPGERLYRTGDRVRRHEDGQLSFVGRVDDQIKVRGFRVEPGEIEAVLRAQPDVEDAVVVLHRAEGQAPRLVAWLLGTASLSMTSVRDGAAATLPTHMVPQHLERLDGWPRTAAGKIDRRALAQRPITRDAAAPDADAAPTDDTQRTLAGIWCEVLGLDRVGIHDDFFALGGDSLLSIRVLARAGKAGLSLSPADFFAHPTVAGQAAAAAGQPARQISQKAVTGPQPLMPIQRWFFDHITRGTAQWNLSYRFDLVPGATLSQVQRAVTALVAHHDALRTAFEQRDGHWVATVRPPADVDVVDEIDLRTEAKVDEALARHADVLNRALRLDAPPLLRVTLAHTPDGQPDALVIAAHHLILDAESWRIVVEDMAAVLAQLDAGRTPSLPPKTNALRDWARRLADWTGNDDFPAAAWRDMLDGASADLEPQATGSGAFTEKDTQTLDVRLDAAQTAGLAEAAAGQRASVYELMVAGVARALGQHLKAHAVRFELEGHGRDPVFEDLDVSRTVGWFTSAYPIVVRDASGFETAAAALNAVKTAMRSVPDNGVSYGALLSANSADGDTARAAGRARVLFNYLGEKQTDGTGRLRLRDDRCGEARSPDAPRAYLLEINAQVIEGELSLSLAWPGPALPADTVNGLGRTIIDTLRALCGDEESSVVPEDFPLANLTAEGLSDLSDLLDELDDD